MAAHRPSLSRRCQSLRRSCVRSKPGDLPAAGVVVAVPARRGTGQVHVEPARAARRGTPRPRRVKAKSIEASTLTRRHVRFLAGRPRRAAMDFTFSADQDALRDARARVPRRPGADARTCGRWSTTTRGFTDDVWDEIGRARLDRRCSCPRTQRRARARARRRGRRARGDGPGAVPGPVPLVGGRAPRSRPRRLGARRPARAARRRARPRGTVALEELGHGDPVDRVRTRAAPQGRPTGCSRVRSRSCSTVTPPTG